MYELHRLDLIYVDELIDWVHHEKYDARFMTLSERFRKNFPGLKFGSDCLVWSDTRRTINFKDYKNILLSKDSSLLDQNIWMFDKKTKYFLDGQKLDDKMAFVSFPRTGNSFLRKYCENITGIFTGADMPLYMVQYLQVS